MRLFKGRSSAQSDFLEMAPEVNVLPGRRQLQTSLDELVVVHPRRACCFWEARVVGGIRKNSGERIYLDDIGGAGGIESNVDARPVPATENAIGIEGHSLDGARKGWVNVGGTIEHVEWP